MTGNKQYILDYNGSKIYPYTLLDCILDKEVEEGESGDITKGVDAIVKRILNSSVKYDDASIGTNYILGYNKNDNGSSFINIAELVDQNDTSYDSHKVFCNNGVFKDLKFENKTNVTTNDNNASKPFGANFSSIKESDKNTIKIKNTLDINLNLNSEYFGIEKNTKSYKVIKADTLPGLPTGGVEKNNNIPVYWTGTEFAQCTVSNFKVNPSMFILPDTLNLNDPDISDDSKYNKYIFCYIKDRSATDRVGTVNAAYKMSCSNLFLRSVTANNVSLNDLAENEDPSIETTYVLTRTYNDTKTYTTKWIKQSAVSIETPAYNATGETPIYFITGCTSKNVTDKSTTELTCSSILDDSKTGIYFKKVSDNSIKLFQTSDERLKHFTSDINIDFSSLAKIKKGEFYWKDDKTKTMDIGVSAQSVEEVYPQLVDETNGIKSVSYDKLGVVALAAIDKLHDRISSLENEIAQLKKQLKDK